MGPLGIPEMIVIGILALLIFGPRKLPELGRSLGKALSEFRRASTDIRVTLEEEVRELDRQARDVESAVESSLTPAEATVPAGSIVPPASDVAQETSGEEKPVDGENNPA